MTDQADSPYTPVSCAVHSEYELAIMHKQLLEMTWQGEDGQEYSDLVTPLDLQSRHHQEFLLGRLADNTEVSIRLDRIIIVSERGH